MAMLGTSANTQCNRYFPGYYSTLDLNAVPNGSSCTLNDDDKYFDSDHWYDRFSSSVDHHLDYNKEVLKTTMLKHEAVFKDQIYELHRLYKRQRELMDGTNKKSLEKDHLMLEESYTNPGFSHTKSGYAPKRLGFSWLNPVCTETSFSVAKNILAPSDSNGGKSKQVGPNPAQAEDYHVDSDLLESKCIKSRKILVDLEPPADAYINSGEGVSFEDGSNDRVPEVASYSTKSIHDSGGLNSVSSLGGTATRNSLPWTINRTDLNKPIDVELDPALESEDSGCQAVSKNMTDAHMPSKLNFSLQGACTGNVFRSSQSAHVQFIATPEPPTSSLLEKTSGKSCSEKAKHGLESSGRNHELLKNKHLGSVGTFNMQISQVIPHVDRTKSMATLVSPWKYYVDDSGRNPIAVQALPCFTNPVKRAKTSECSILSKELARGQIQHSNSRPSSGIASFLQGGLSNCSLSELDKPKASPLSVSLTRFGLASKQHSSSKYGKSPNPPDAKSTKYLNLNLIPDSCSSDVAVLHDVNLVTGKQVFQNSGIEIGFKNKLSLRRDHIDLNSCINEDESFPMSTSLINLKAPVIPENKECPPFGGKSDDNQLEIPFQQSGHKDGYVEQELARCAAEAIVFISSSVAESCQEKVAASGLSEDSFNESLLWFAGIVVSSQVADTENSCDYKKHPSDEIDFFEAMTLKLRETKAEEYWQKGSDQKQEITSVLPLPNQVKRGRTKRGRQRKDFQNEVLPGIASLSRNEVSKDLQTIGGLIENAHACGTSLAPCAGRNGRARGKRGSFNPCMDETVSMTRATHKQKTSNSKMDETESMTRVTHEQKTSNSKMGFERSLIGWGKITRGPRRQRHPASKPLHFKATQ